MPAYGPQWLEMALGVKRALGTLLGLIKKESSDTWIWNVAQYVVIKGKVTSFSALPAQRIWPANETMS